LEGAYISEFPDNSPAKTAGLEVGDVITAINGMTVKSFNALQEQISKYRPGDKVKVDVDRYGTAKSFTVELRNAQGNTDVVEKTKDSAEILGATFQALSDARKRELNKSYGLEVTGVSRGGKISDAGIRRGFIIETVNNQRVSTPDDLDKIVNLVLGGTTEDKGLFIRGLYIDDRNQRTEHYAINLVD
jgi:S1-C subfamily serine protease